jgi:ADP-ribose pyrophosphatase YjhB (NUDIX family)
MNDLKFADVLVFKIDSDSTISILLGTRTNERNFSGKQCIPGGHLKVGENAKCGAIRELNEETNLDISPLINKLRQVSVYHADPNIEWKSGSGVTFAVVLPHNFKYTLRPQPEEMSDVRWYENDQIPYNNMAFDHGEKVKEILKYILTRRL